MKTALRLSALAAAVLIGGSGLAACADKTPTDTSASTTTAITGVTEDISGVTGETTGEASGSADGTDSSQQGGNQQPGPAQTTKKSNATAAPTTVKPLEKKKTKDLGGREIGMRVEDGMFPGDGKSQLDARLNEHLVKLEKDFNVKIKLLKGEKDYASTMAAGAYFADIAYAAGFHLKNFIRNGWVKSFDELGINPNQDKFVPSYRKAMRYDKKDYALNFTSWYNHIITFDRCLLYNKDALSRRKLADPQTLIEQNKWTWSAFQSISKQFASQGQGYYGSTGHSPHEQAVWSTGSREIMWNNQTKKWVFGYRNNTKVFEALEWTMELWHHDKTYLPLQEDWTYNSYEVFNKGKSAFLVGEIDWISYGFYEEMEDDYALVPFPTQNGKPYTAGRLSTNIRSFYIPQTAKNPEDVALFFDAWSEPLPGTTYNTWESSMLENVWRGNEKSLKWFKTMLQTAESDHYIDIGHERIYPLSNAISEVVVKRSMTGAEAVESIAAQMDAFIDEYINKDPKLNLEG